MKRTTIHVGQRLTRWDGEPGYVDMNSRGTRVYETHEPFQILWADGDSEYCTLAEFETEGIVVKRGRMPWAR